MNSSHSQFEPSQDSVTSFMLKPHKYKSASIISNHSSKITFINRQKNFKANQISSSKATHNKIIPNCKLILNESKAQGLKLKEPKKRMSISFSKKLHNINNDSIFEEFRHKKYIINEPKHQIHLKKAEHSLKKSKQTIVSIHNKTLSNQSVVNLVNPNHTFLKAKLKKKAPKYIKSFKKTGGVDKSISLIRLRKSPETTHLQNSSLNGLLQKQKNRNYQQVCLQKNDDFKLLEFQLLRSKNKYHLSRIQSVLTDLVIRKGTKTKNQLLSVTSDYNKIIYQLYEVLRKHEDNDAQSTMPQTPTKQQSLDSQEKSENSSVSQLDRSSSTLTMSNINEKLSCRNSYKNQATLYQDNMPIWNQKNQSSKSLKSPGLKKLNLQNIRQSFNVKEYHEEFMEMKENFSESWKRQLEKERKF